VNVFCSALLQTFTAVPGQVFTLVPIGVSQNRLTCFSEGGLLPQSLTQADVKSLPDGSTLVPKLSLVEPQTRLLRQTMMSAAGAVCIIDDFNPRWSERACGLGPHAFGVGEEVYHLLSADDQETDFMNSLGSGDTIWHGVAAVCRKSPHLNLQRETTESELELCATSALLVTCTAYDGEGFVAWRHASVEKKSLMA
jgi:hypothetical protein